MQLRLPLLNASASDRGSDRCRHDFYEFFAGGGMARAGLGSKWVCQFANDIDPKKAAAYVSNWGADNLHVADIASLQLHQVPGHVDLAWASFPCQDLSLAGAGAGLDGRRSGTFWPLWGLIRALAADHRPPRTLVLENVCGALTSHEGRDFITIGRSLGAAGYNFGALVIDGVHFVPQSRPRLFIIGVHESIHVPKQLSAGLSTKLWHSKSLTDAYSKLPDHLRVKWIWWNMPMPPPRGQIFSDLIEDDPVDVRWHTVAETAHIVSLMNEANLRKLRLAQASRRRMVGTIYRRTRPDQNGVKRQRAEIRFDDIAGCLRTPAGGSSRQTIMIVDGENVRSRLLSPREAARLMGLPDSYKLPERYNEAYHLAGDGVVVPVVRFLAAHVLEQVLAGNEAEITTAAA